MISTWKQPDELSADLSFSSSICAFAESCDDVEKRLISMIGIWPTSGEDSIAPKMPSLTIYSGGGSTPLIDISRTLMDNFTEAVSSSSRAMFLFDTPMGWIRNHNRFYKHHVRLPQ